MTFLLLYFVYGGSILFLENTKLMEHHTIMILKNILNACQSFTKAI